MRGMPAGSNLRAGVGFGSRAEAIAGPGCKLGCMCMHILRTLHAMDTGPAPLDTTKTEVYEDV